MLTELGDLWYSIKGKPVMMGKPLWAPASALWNILAPVFGSQEEQGKQPEIKHLSTTHLSPPDELPTYFRRREERPFTPPPELSDEEMKKYKALENKLAYLYRGPLQHIPPNQRRFIQAAAYDAYARSKGDEKATKEAFYKSLTQILHIFRPDIKVAKSGELEPLSVPKSATKTETVETAKQAATEKGAGLAAGLQAGLEAGKIATPQQPVSKGKKPVQTAPPYTDELTAIEEKLHQVISEKPPRSVVSNPREYANWKKDHERRIFMLGARANLLRGRQRAALARQRATEMWRHRARAMLKDPDGLRYLQEHGIDKKAVRDFINGKGADFVWRYIANYYSVKGEPRRQQQLAELKALAGLAEAVTPGTAPQYTGGEFAVSETPSVMSPESQMYGPPAALPKAGYATP